MMIFLMQGGVWGPKLVRWAHIFCSFDLRKYSVLFIHAPPTPMTNPTKSSKHFPATLVSHAHGTESPSENQNSHFKGSISPQEPPLIKNNKAKIPTNKLISLNYPMKAKSTDGKPLDGPSLMEVYRALHNRNLPKDQLSQSSPTPAQRRGLKPTT